MGSVLSSAYAAPRSFVDALLDKVDMWWLIATDPYVRSLTSAEEREKTRRWYRELDRDDWHKELELDRDDSRSTGFDFKNLRERRRCNYRHPCYRDKVYDYKYK